MKDLVDQPTRDEKGRFLPGNPLWQLHAFADGHIGLRDNAWSPEECAEIMALYIQDRMDNDRTITKAGLYLALGLSKEACNNYAKGEYGKSDEDRRAYIDLFSLASTVMEDQLEEQLSRDKGQVNGVIFRLKNHYGWRDERHLSLETNELRTIKLIVQGGELSQRLKDQGEVIEGEVVEKTD